VTLPLLCNCNFALSPGQDQISARLACQALPVPRERLISSGGVQFRAGYPVLLWGFRRSVTTGARAAGARAAKTPIAPAR
jgi:hypothetical protein